MSNILFGIDIAQLVDNSLQQAGGVGTGVLIKRENTGRTPGNLTGGQNPSETRYDFRGFLDNRSEERRNGSLVSAGGDIVSILGNSLPSGVVPAQSDQIEIENTTFEVLEIVARDPAAALYECRVGGV